MDIVNEEYSTRDMALSACLLLDGVRYLRVEKDVNDDRRLIFVFEADPQIERIIQQRSNGTHVVSSIHYDDCLRRMKSVIHSCGR